MPVDISTAELRTMLRTHTSRKRDGTKRAPKRQKALEESGEL